MKELTDEELFARVQKHNDQEAFRTLYRRYDRRLYAYCLRALGTKQAAEDVFQTVAMTIYDKRDSFTGGSFAAWLFTITRNFCIKANKKNKHNANIDDVSFALQDHSDRTGNDVIMQDALKKAISALSDEYRESLELRYFDGFSYEQIADIAGITLSLAKVRVFRAKQMLQKSLSPYLQEIL